MRSLSGTLLAAVAAPGRQPAISATLADVAEHYALLRDDHATTPDAPSAAVVAADGSLIRAYVSLSGGSGTSSLYVQRITDVTQPAQWAAWTLLESGNVFGACPPALSMNAGGVLRLFFADGPSGGTTVRLRQSADNGASWATASSVFSGSATTGALASAGNDDLFAALEPSLGSWSVSFCHLSGGVWDPPAAWSAGSFSLMSGLAALWDGSRYHLAVSVWATSGLSLQGWQFDGTSWTASGGIVPLDAGNSGLQLRFPALAQFGGLYRLAYVEHDDGSVDANPYDRVRLTASADFIHWSDDRPPVSGQAVQNSPAWVQAGGNWYVLNCAYVFGCTPWSASDPTRNSDVSSQVLSYERQERPLAASQLQLVLSNQGGQDNPGLPGLVRGARLTLWEGYVTSAGRELVTVGQYYLEHWFYQRGAGENELVIAALDASWRLDREASRQWVYAGQTVGWLMQDIAAKAGLLAVSLPGTTQFSQLVGAFTVAPGETWRLALHRLIALYGAEYYVDATEQLVVRELSPADPPAWSVGPEILGAQWGTGVAANHVQVFGNGALGEAWDFAAAAQCGVERCLQVLDRQLTTAAQCQLRATLELQAEQRKASGGVLDVPLHPGVELFDVLAATDAAAGLASQPYRVQGLRSVLNVLRADYELRLELSGV